MLKQTIPSKHDPLKLCSLAKEPSEAKTHHQKNLETPSSETTIPFKTNHKTFKI